ncbi:MAG TPA: VCBS repeat-containing protein [Verrucomicrobiae bacterium]|nr:VCBS repeat-containing protein [Verrucomicrobiae bacterium]
MQTSNFFKAAARMSAGLLVATLLIPSAFADDTNRFGFTGPEIYPIDPSIALLRSADLNGDGLNDLIVVNNSRSKINLLYNQTGKTNKAENLNQTGKLELNELPPDARFRIESIASEKRISSLVVADLNGDGKPDLAYYGEPKELVVQYNLGTNGWSEPKRWAIDDGQLSPNALVAGDINGDYLTDLVLLGETQIYVLSQKPDHTLGEPEKIPYSGAVKAIQLLDIDGDGRTDLMLVNWESPTPFRFRLQNESGGLGPETYFTFPPIRSYWADNLEGNNKNQIITIAQNSGRAEVSEFTRTDPEKLSGDFKEGQFQVLPLNKSDRSHRGMLWADVNGDNLPDLLVAEPESGQISIYLQKPDGTLDAAKTFPTLTGVSDLAVADWGNGKPSIFLLSADEHQVGVAQLDEKGRLPFPTLIPFDGKPLTMAVGALEPKGKSVLAVIVDQDGKRSLVTRTSDGKTKTQKLNENFKSNPTSMAFHDVNQDGLADLVILIPYEKIKVLLQVSGKDFDEEDIAPPGGSVEEPWMTSVDVDGDGKPELLLAQKNFLRAVVAKQEAATQNSTNRGGWVFSVKEQINGAGSNSRLVGAAALPNGTNAVNSIFMLDAERKVITFCERDNAGVWQVVKNISLPYTSFNALQPLALGGSKPNSVAFLGKDAVGWLPLHGKVWQFTQLDSYETPIKDGHLNDIVSGDLDNDGRKDLVFLETAKNYLDLVTFDANRKLVPANRWPVFEERTFRSRRSDLPEPREALVTDVTGDGKNDLVILVHDRILVYPQQ